MNYHDIKHDDMNNGSGLRVTLFVSGCEHHCKDCHNPETWDIKSGIRFDKEAKKEIFELLEKDYISGITLSGGDPLNENNIHDIFFLCTEIRQKYPNKNIWLYTGFLWEDITKKTIGSIENMRYSIIELCDVVVDGRFENEKADVNYHWAGSTNQRVIDVKESLKKGEVILYR